METGKSLHPFYRVWYIFSYILHLVQLPRLCMITYSLQEDYIFFPQEPCQMIIKVVFISSFILGQHGFVHYAQCITCITLCSCTFTSHPFHLPCFRLFVPLFLHCISAARTENTVTLFCAEKKKETPLHQTSPCKAPLSSSHNDRTENSI